MPRIIFQQTQWVDEGFPQGRGTDDGNALEMDDSGAALIAHFSGEGDEDAGLFVQVQSWNESIWGITETRAILLELAQAHPDFCTMLGHRVRVTVEVLE